MTRLPVGYTTEAGNLKKVWSLSLVPWKSVKYDSVMSLVEQCCWHHYFLIIVLDRKKLLLHYFWSHGSLLPCRLGYCSHILFSHSVPLQQVEWSWKGRYAGPPFSRKGKDHCEQSQPKLLGYFFCFSNESFEWDSMALVPSSLNINESNYLLNSLYFIQTPGIHKTAVSNIFSWQTRITHLGSEVAWH